MVDVDPNYSKTQSMEEMAGVHRRPSETLPYKRGKATTNPPVVTVFGAGIAGLTAAHELIQRGFNVQIIEPTRSLDERYACEVGGLAQTQTTRINETRRLHWALYDKDDQYAYRMAYPELGAIAEEKGLYADLINDPDARKANLETLSQLREMSMQRVQRRYGFTEWIQTPLAADFSMTAQVAPLKSGLPPNSDDLVTHIEAHSTNDRDTLKFGEELLAELEDWAGEVQASVGAGSKIYTNDYKMEQLCIQLVEAFVEYSKYLEDRLILLGERTGQFPSLHPDVRRREVLLIEVHGHSAVGNDRNARARVGKAWAGFVRAWAGAIIRATLAGWDKYPRLAEVVHKHVDNADVKLAARLSRIEAHMECVGYGESGLDESNMPAAELHLARNRVDFRVVEHVLQGEHGFRFFPAFYRHIHDTMGRTPLLNDRLEETGRTVLDQLVTPPQVRIGTTGGGEGMFPSTPKTGEDSRKGLEWFVKHFDATLRDLLRYQIPMLKFLTSCRERRTQYEDMSWIEFIDGKNERVPRVPEAGLEPTSYTPRFDELLRRLPATLVAMRAEETDATTNAAVATQMALGSMGRLDAEDRMLDGTTSVAWLDHWKAYLQRQGVKFFNGRLKHLYFDGEELRARVEGPGPGGLPLSEDPFSILADVDTDEPNSDFFILALPYVQAADAVANLNNLVNRIGSLREKLADVSANDTSDSDSVKALRDEIREGAWWTWLIEAANKLSEAIEYGLNQDEATTRHQFRPLLTHGLHSDAIDERTRKALEVAKVELTHACEYLQLWPKGDVDPREAVRSLEQPRAIRNLVELFKGDQIQKLVNYRLINAAYDELQVELRMVRFLPRGIVHAVTNLRPYFQASDSSQNASTSELKAGVERLIQALEHWHEGLLDKIDGDLAQLLVMDRHTGRRDRKGQPVGRPYDASPSWVQRDALGLPQPQFQYPLRDLTGMQFYFRDLVQVATGHFVLPDSCWGLSGIAQMALWRTRPSAAYGFLGQLSIDIGSFCDIYPSLNEKDRPLGLSELPMSAWQCSDRELADRVWSQILESGSKGYAQRVSAPHYFQIDNGLHFGDGGEGPCVLNTNMLMINLPGQWQHRPGLYSGKSHQLKYRPTCDRWLGAGTYMATHTRLTTMEAANESARHAVNAIIDTLCNTTEPSLYNSGGQFVGDQAATWDMQENEFSELDSLKRLDQALFERGAPHFLDILGVAKLIDALPVVDDPSQTQLMNFKALLEEGMKEAATEWDFLKPKIGDVGLFALDGALDDLRKVSDLSDGFLEMLKSALSSGNSS